MPKELYRLMFALFLIAVQYCLAVPLKRWQSWALWLLWRTWGLLKPERSFCLILYRWDVHVDTPDCTSCHMSVVFYAVVFVSPFICCLFRMTIWVPQSYHPTKQQTDLLLPHWIPPLWSPQHQFYPETPWSTVQLWSWNGGRKSRRTCLTMRWK